MAPRVFFTENGLYSSNQNGMQEREADVTGRSRPARVTASLRLRVKELFNLKASPREMYQAGQSDGRRCDFENLTDILFFMRDRRLGRMSLLQESNKHVVFKVYNCVCCEMGTAQNCHYLAGFLAGALQVTGRPDTVRVREVSCGGGPGWDCVFEANW